MLHNGIAYAEQAWNGFNESLFCYCTNCSQRSCGERGEFWRFLQLGITPNVLRHLIFRLNEKFWISSSHQTLLKFVHARISTACSSRLCSSGFWKPPRLETPRPLWRTDSSVWTPLMWKGFGFVMFERNFLHFNLHPLPLALSLDTTD